MPALAIDVRSRQAIARVPLPPPAGELRFVANRAGADLTVGLGGWSLPYLHRLDVGGSRLHRAAGGVESVRVRHRGDELIVSRRGGRSLLHFDAAGRLTRVVDAMTDRALYQVVHDTAGLARVTDRRGRVLAVGRDGELSLDVAGRRIELARDPAGWLAAVRLDDGTSWSVRHDPTGRLVELIDPGGGVRRLVYDGDELRRVTEPHRHSDLVHEARDGWSRTSLVRSSGEESSVVIEHLADGTVRETARCCGSAAPVVTDRRTDGETVVTEADGTVVSYRRTQSASPVWGSLGGGEVVFEVERRTPGGRRSLTRRRLVIDDRRRSETIERDGRVYERHHDREAGRVVTRSPVGRLDVLYLDPEGRAIRAERPGRAVVANTFGGDGSLLRSTNGPLTVETHVGPAGELVLADGEATVSVVDEPRARRSTSTLGDGRVVRYQLDEDGRRMEATVDGSLLYATERVDGRTIRTLLPAVGGVESSVTRISAPSGRLVEAIDGARHVRFDRDAAGRLERVASADGEVVVTRPHAGEVVVATGLGEVVRVERDGPLVTAWTTEGRAPGRIELVYDGHRPSGRRVGDVELALERDPDGLIVAEGPVRLDRHRDSGLVEGIEVGEVTTTLHRDEHHRVIATRVAVGDGTVIAGFDYQLDHRSRTIGLTEHLDGASQSFEARYDAAGRLDRLTAADGRTVFGAAHDRRGNRIRTERVDAVVDAVVDARDRLVRWGDANVSYDGSDRLDTIADADGSISFGYDGLGDLTWIRRPDGSIVQYVHDGLGRRTAVAVDGTYLEAYLHLGGQLLARLEPGGAVREVYINAGLRVPVAMIRDGRTYALISDRVGTIRMVLDAETGAVVQRVDTDVDGRIVADTSPGFTAFAFAGGLADPATDLVTFGARHYSPTHARWTERDPALGHSGRLNFHAYASGDPLNRVDPTGLTDIPVPLEPDGDYSANPIPQAPSLCATAFTTTLDHGMACVGGRCWGMGGGFGDTHWEEQTDWARNHEHTSCEEIPDADPECVQRKVEEMMGERFGVWGTTLGGEGESRPDICWDPAYDVMEECGGDPYGHTPTATYPSREDDWYMPPEFYEWRHKVLDFLN